MENRIWIYDRRYLSLLTQRKREHSAVALRRQLVYISDKGWTCRSAHCYVRPDGMSKLGDATRSVPDVSDNGSYDSSVSELLRALRESLDYWRRREFLRIVGRLPMDMAGAVR